MSEPKIKIKWNASGEIKTAIGTKLVEVGDKYHLHIRGGGYHIIAKDSIINLARIGALPHDGVMQSKEGCKKMKFQDGKIEDIPKTARVRVSLGAEIVDDFIEAGIPARRIIREKDDPEYRNIAWSVSRVLKDRKLGDKVAVSLRGASKKSGKEGELWLYKIPAKKKEK